MFLSEMKKEELEALVGEQIFIKTDKTVIKAVIIDDCQEVKELITVDYMNFAFAATLDQCFLANEFTEALYA